MQYLWYCEIKKLMSNKNFVLVVSFFLVLIAGVQMVQLYLPRQDKITALELTSCFEAYAESNHLEEQLADRLERLECRADVEKLSVLTGDLKVVLLENLMNKWGMTEQQLMELDEPLLYCDNVEEEILLLNTLFQYTEQINSYPDYVQEILAWGERIQESALYKNDAYALSVAEKTSQAYQKLQDLELDVINPTGVEVAMGNWADDVARFLFCCMSCMFLFQTDKENGLISLLFSTQNGRKRLYWCKICVALACNVLFCMVTLCMQAAAGIVLDGTVYFGLPVQTLTAYYKCPYELTIGNAICLNGILKIWNTLIQTILVSVCFVTFEFIVAWIGIILTFIFSLVLYIGISDSSILQPVKYMNLVSFSQTENLLGDLIFIKAGSTPILYQNGMIAITIVLLLIALGIGFCNFKYHTPRQAGKLKLCKKQKGKIRSLFVLEIKKLIRPHAGLLILGISILVQVIFYFTMCSGIGFEEQLLENRLRQIEGNYSAEIHQALLQEMEEVQSGKRLYSDAQTGCLEQLLAISRHLGNIEPNVEPYYVYSGGYEALVGIRKVSFSYQNLGISISLCLLLVGIFVQEEKEGMCYLNQTTLHRKKICRTKCVIVLLVSVLACIFWWLPECIFIFQNFYVSNPFVNVASVPVLSDYPGQMTLWQLVAAVWFVRIIRSVVTGLLIACASYKARNYAMTWFLTAVFVFGQWILILATSQISW